jgi:hypothetical protein
VPRAYGGNKSKNKEMKKWENIKYIFKKYISIISLPVK